MSIETQCSGCQNILRVADEHAGKQARCPVCNTIYTVPAATTQIPPASERPQNAQWEVRIAGNQYGPVTTAELDRWVSESRLDANSLIRELPSGDWMPIGKMYPVVTTAAPRNPFADMEVPAEPSARPANDAYLPQHRGGLILGLGIASWFCFCPILPVIGWYMGMKDLKAMRLGQMDASGRGLTQAGLVLCVLQLALFVFSTLSMFFLFLVRA